MQLYLLIQLLHWHLDFNVYNNPKALKLLSTQILKLLSITIYAVLKSTPLSLRQTFLHKSLCSFIFWNASLMSFFKSPILLGFQLWTLFLSTPQKKTSIGVKSGEHAGQSIGPHQPIHLSWNASRYRSGLLLNNG